jgi:DNA-directed RNA polymerase subunit RPC12/RpoP
MMANYIAMEDKAPHPLLDVDDKLHNFTLRIAGKPYRCPCGCNVFHKPDREHLDQYQCNGCGQQFEAA